MRFLGAMCERTHGDTFPMWRRRPSYACHAIARPLVVQKPVFAWRRRRGKSMFAHTRHQRVRMHFVDSAGEPLAFFTRVGVVGAAAKRSFNFILSRKLQHRFRIYCLRDMALRFGDGMSFAVVMVSVFARIRVHIAATPQHNPRANGNCESCSGLLL